MAKKKSLKMTPEEKAKWQENHDRLQRIIERRLAEEAARAEAAGQVRERS